MRKREIRHHKESVGGAHMVAGKAMSDRSARHRRGGKEVSKIDERQGTKTARADRRSS